MTTRYYILEGDSTTAQGVVQKTTNSLSFQVHGKEQSYIGDDVWCPACQTMGKIVPDKERLATQVNGCLPALNDDLCICQCNPPPKLVHSQTSFMEVTKSNTLASDSHSDDSALKSIVELYWSYGENCMPLFERSRFYPDVNLHIRTLGYKKGEIARVLISSGETSFFVDIIIDSDCGVFYNVFGDRSILIEAE